MQSVAFAFAFALAFAFAFAFALAFALAFAFALVVFLRLVTAIDVLQLIAVEVTHGALLCLKSRAGWPTREGPADFVRITIS
jgi:hypothetical protein